MPDQPFETLVRKDAIYFGASDDQTIRIRKLFEEIGL
jgi:hypothetical protein